MRTSHHGPTTAIIAGQLIDGTGGPPASDMVILIAGERVLTVGRRSDVRIPPEVDEAKWETLRRAKSAGVKIAAGSDAGFVVAHGESARELEELVKGGFTPHQAIGAATRVAAECLGLEQDIGTIEPGKFADIVVVEGDPLGDVRILQDKEKIAQVLIGGQTVARRAA